MSPVNGLRPSPLRISKDSHVIQKSSSSSSSFLHQHQNQVAMANKQPVVIYTHSPQTIHTNPRDFMAVVQKLTGCSTSTASTSSNNKTQGGGGGHQSNRVKQNNITISRDGDGDGDGKFEGEMMINYNQRMMAEIPLFTPSSTNLFFSPKGLLRNPADDEYQTSPGIAGSLSPSFMEFFNMKELP